MPEIISVSRASSTKTEDIQDAFDLPRLFHPRNFDHLEIHEQAAKFKRRDIDGAHLYRTAAKMFGPAHQRLRRYPAEQINIPEQNGYQYHIPRSGAVPLEADGEAGDFVIPDSAAAPKDYEDCRKWIAQRFVILLFYQDRLSEALRAALLLPTDLG